MSITTSQHAQGTNPAKKIWKTPKIFLLDSNDIHAKGARASVEIHNGNHNRLKTPGGLTFSTSPASYYSCHFS